MFTVVIGGGAAGLIAAAASAAAGSGTLLLEKNEKPGKKIYITGKGRCNVTNACDFDSFLSNIVRNPRFMYSSLRGFGPEDLMRLIEENGVHLKTERGNRVFPVSDHASDITKALTRACERAGAEVRLRTEVTEIEHGENGFSLSCVSDGRHFRLSADRVIVCTGGLSYPATGSTGDGYRFAENFGLKVLPQSPSLTGIVIREPVCEKLAGISLNHTALSVFALKNGRPVGKPLFSETGELMFTHTGISGPLVLTASSILSGRISAETPYLFSIDLKPGLTEEMLQKRILRDFSERPNMDIGNGLSALLISGIREAVLEMAGISREKKIHDITKEERSRLAACIRRFDLTAVGTGGFSEAVITRGGVDVRELDPATMGSKKIPGLYFAGEVVDVDAFTGGFNLQCAFSMGYAAGRAGTEEKHA